MNVSLARLPVWCKPILSYDEPTIPPSSMLLDFDKGLIYVIVRRLDDNTYLAFPKYKILRRKGLTISRIVNTYSPRSIVQASKELLVYDPRYGITVPRVSIKPGMILCDVLEARDHVNEVIQLNRHGEILTKLVDILGIDVTFTGSILLGYALKLSDVDLVATSHLESIKLVHSIDNALREGVLKPLTGPYLEDWIQREARSRGLPLNILAKVYDAAARFKFMGVTFSVSYIDFNLRIERERRIFIVTDRLVDDVCTVRPYSSRVLDYPSLAPVDECLKLNVDYIVSFDGIYVVKLLRGGPLRVRGLIGKAMLEDERSSPVVVIGVREIESYVYPLHEQYS